MAAADAAASRKRPRDEGDEVATGDTAASFWKAQLEAVGGWWFVVGLGLVGILLGLFGVFCGVYWCLLEIFGNFLSLP